MSKIAAYVEFTIQPGKRDEALELLRGAVAEARNEEGTLFYALHEDPKAPDTLVMYELYADKDALKAHSSTEAFLAMVGKLGGLSAGTPVMKFLTPIDGKGL